MTPTPGQAFLHLGRNPADISEVSLLSERHGHRIWRIRAGGESFVVKWFPNAAAAAVELGSYQLLQELGVATLQLFGHTDQSLLLEDVDSSPQWRLATESDAAIPEVGAAVGQWYKEFHQRGRALCEARVSRPPYLCRESDRLTRQALADTARVLDLADAPALRLAADCLETLQAAESRLSTTLTYNDFHWTNLALSRAAGESLQAVVFDYHLLGIGMRYSDCRNVTSSLGSAAAAGFWAAYGFVDPREIVLDKPLSILYDLVVAASLPAVPKWARESRTRVQNGDLLSSLNEAIDLSRRILDQEH